MELDLSSVSPVRAEDSEGLGFLGLKPDGYQLNINDFSTGQVIAVTGVLSKKGVLKASEIIFPGYFQPNSTKIYQELSPLFK